MKTFIFGAFLFLIQSHSVTCQNARPRSLGFTFGVMEPGLHNAITDVPGVRVGQITMIEGDKIRTGVTAILPHTGNIFQEKVPAAMYIGNGFGKLMGISQVEELGNIETPILLTNTLSVPDVASALADYVLEQPGNEEVRSVNPIVGETNDGRLNDIRRKVIAKEHVFDALKKAEEGPVQEGNVGAGTGTICFGFKGGIGTASRKLPESLGGYTIGVLVQTNFGGNLVIDGIPVGEKLNRYPYRQALEKSDGSCMIVVGTNAPLSSRNLKRLAKRALIGLGKTGGIMSNGSGDYVIAFSNHPDMRIPYNTKERLFQHPEIHNDYMTPLFMGVIEATEEAIINSLFAAKTMTGNGYTIESIPIEEIMKMKNEMNQKE